MLATPFLCLLADACKGHNDGAENAEKLFLRFALTLIFLMPMMDTSARNEVLALNEGFEHNGFFH